MNFIYIMDMYKTKNERFNFNVKISQKKKAVFCLKLSKLYP